MERNNISIRRLQGGLQDTAIWSHGCTEFGCSDDCWRARGAVVPIRQQILFLFLLTLLFMRQPWRCMRTAQHACYIPEQRDWIGIGGVGYKQLAAFDHRIMKKRDLVACQGSINFIRRLVIAIIDYYQHLVPCCGLAPTADTPFRELHTVDSTCVNNRKGKKMCIIRTSATAIEWWVYTI